MSRNHREFANAVLGKVGESLFGLDHVVRLCLVALYAKGHVLLEGNPGLGKTELVKTLSKVLEFSFNRIQFTPDLMPADITGTFSPDPENVHKLDFRHGPIFTNLLLADEINRATPKTQSAMLQVMAEGEVTVLGKTDSPPKPFMVLATQNPIDHEGTYTLPEAQSDRFLFRINMPTPNRDTALRILKKTAGALAREFSAKKEPKINEKLLPKGRNAAREKFERLHTAILETRPQLVVEEHITNMFLASNGRFDELEGLNARQLSLLKEWHSVWDYGLGPRAVSALMLGAKAWALLFHGDVETAGGRALAQVAPPALRHRIRLSFEWPDLFRSSLRMTSEDPVNLETFLIAFVLVTAPREKGYHSILRGAFGERLCPQLKQLKIIE